MVGTEAVECTKVGAVVDNYHIQRMRVVVGYSTVGLVEKVPALGIGGEPLALYEGRVQRKVGREWSGPPP